MSSRKPRSFKLSEEAIESLERISDLTGLTNTAVVHIALFEYRKYLESRQTIGGSTPLPTLVSAHTPIATDD